MDLATLKLRKNEDRRLRAGHVWIYSNEIDTAATPLAQFEAGQEVLIEDHHGKPLGTGYVNPHTLICARLVSRDARLRLNKSLLTHRFNVALSVRESLFAQPYYRLAYGEGDGVPGLIVDRYGEVLVCQINTAGMERHCDDIVAALEQTTKARSIVLRNDTAARDLEKLPKYVGAAYGELPERIHIQENGAAFDAALHGQKTGWFYDHRMNRARMQHYVRGKRVLDVFSYVGGWAVQAALGGAREVMCVDASAAALEQARDNAARNGVGDQVHVLAGDAFEIMAELREGREKYDVIVLDPPAFIKRKKDHGAGLAAYRKLNQQAMQLLAKDGILISASCSFHLAREELAAVMLQSSRHVDRSMQLLEQGHQGPDHPVHPAIPETDYLKAYFARVLPS